MLTKIDPKDVQAGDRVTLTGTVVVVYSDKSGAKIKFGDTIEIVSKASLSDAIVERVDHDLLKAREIVAEVNDGSHLSEWVARVMEGRCDGHREMKIALAALKAGRDQ